MELKFINSSDAPSPAGGYSQAVQLAGHARLLYISGQIPVDAHGRTPTSFTDQCRLAWTNVRAQLGAAGMTVSDLIKVTIFLSSREFADENRAIRRDFLGDHAPAMTVIITGIFDESWLLEIEAIAAA